MMMVRTALVPLTKCTKTKSKTVVSFFTQVVRLDSYIVLLCLGAAPYLHPQTPNLIYAFTTSMLV